MEAVVSAPSGLHKISPTWCEFHYEFAQAKVAGHGQETAEMVSFQIAKSSCWWPAAQIIGFHEDGMAHPKVLSCSDCQAVSCHLAEDLEEEKKHVHKACPSLSMTGGTALPKGQGLQGEEMVKKLSPGGIDHSHSSREYPGEDREADSQCTLSSISGSPQEPKAQRHAGLPVF